MTKKSETSHRIIRAAREEFKTKGYENASMRDIAQRAGYTTGVLYSRYKDKEELFSAVVKLGEMAMEDKISDSLQGRDFSASLRSGRNDNSVRFSNFDRHSVGKPITSENTPVISTNVERSQSHSFVSRNTIGARLLSIIDTVYTYKDSPYDVKVIFQNEDPLGLVRFAQKNVAKSNQVWVVFDVDNTYGEGSLLQAIVEAEKNGVKCAISNMAFEVWLISHFQKCKQELYAVGHERTLNKYLDEKKKGFTYSKNDEGLLKKYFIPNYRTAVENSKIVYQERMKDFLNTHASTARPKIWEWNSCSTVYKLVEALKLLL